MFFSERFWSITAPKLSDVALAALVAGLELDSDKHPPGVFRATKDTLVERFRWAADYILGEFSAAPSVTIDQRAGLGVVWSEIHAPVIANPNMARSRGARVAAVHASFIPEVLALLRAQLKPAAQLALDAGAASVGRTKALPPPRTRARFDRYEATLIRAKLRERQLREPFGVEDMGEQPSVADRRAVVRIMGTGATSQQVLEALEGRAERCRQQRMWKGNDTAEKYLRLTFICDDTGRFQEALAWAPAPPIERAVVRTEHGTFVGGRQLTEPPAVPAAEVKFEDPEDALGILRNWGKNHSKQPEE